MPSFRAFTRNLGRSFFDPIGALRGYEKDYRQERLQNRYAREAGMNREYLGMNYQNMTPEQRSSVRDFYMERGTDDWNDANRPGAETYSTWFQNNRINPNTGLLEGDFPFVPHTYARQIQMEADMVADRRRQSMMQGGINYMQGATGLLQSYRPGGSAALESGIYGQTAGLMFERARMTQPLDYMSDLRRQEQDDAASRARRAERRSQYVQIGTSLATLAVGALTGGAGAAAMAAIPAAGAAMASRVGGGGGYSYSGGQMGAYDSYDTQTSTLNTMGQAGVGTGTAGGGMTQGPAFPGAPAQGGGAAGPMAGPMPGPTGAPAAPPAATSGARLVPEGAGGAPAGGPMPSGGPAGPVAGGGGTQAMPSMGAGAEGMAAPAMFGQTGDFTTQGMAASASQMGPSASLETIGERMGLMDYAADLYDSDPFHATYGAAVNQLYSSVLESMQGVSA